MTEWSVLAQDLTLQKVVVAFRHQPLSWTSVRVGYWASARPDILVGATTASFGSLKNGSAPVVVNFANAIPNANSAIARAFLTGYKMVAGNEIFIRAFDKAVSANRVELGVQVAGSMEISSAQVNYVVFSPSTAVFASYGGGVSENNFSQSKIYNLQRFIHSSPYAFYGLANIRHSSAGVSAVNSDITSDFYLRIDSLRPFNELFLSYIIVGVNPATACAACPERIISPSSCVASCPSDTYAVSYKDGGRGCRTCPGQYNLVINANGDGCACRSGFVERNGFCVIANSAGQQGQGQQ